MTIEITKTDDNQFIIYVNTNVAVYVVSNPEDAINVAARIFRKEFIEPETARRG